MNNSGEADKPKSPVKGKDNIQKTENPSKSMENQNKDNEKVPQTGNDNSQETEKPSESIPNQDIDSDKNSQKGKPDKGKNKTLSLTDILNILKLLGSLGSGIVIVLTAIRAHSFSDYYGIPFSNLINIKIAGELIIKVIPIVVIATFIAFSLFLAKSKNTFSKNRGADTAGNLIVLTMLIIGTAFYMVLYCYDICSNFLPGIATLIILIILTSLLITIRTGFVPLYVLSRYIHDKDSSQEELKLSDASNKSKEKKVAIYEGWMVALLTLILSTYTFFIFMPFMWDTLNTYSNPKSENKYEIVTEKVDNEIVNEYVTICDTSDGKLVIECDINRETKKLTLKKGHYKYLEIDGNDFEYFEFDEVNIS